MVDHLTPNETEAAALTGLKIENEEEAIVAARTLLARGVRKAVHLTMGKAGVVSVPAGDGPVIRVPSFKVQAVDTTGAGDAFSGGFAAALVEGMAREKALIFASATAALSVTKHGTAPAMPSRAEIDSFLAEHS
jgi:ribokinase